jgi:hypothetical protein
MKICCENCAYFDIVLDSNLTLWGCKLHNLYDGEVSPQSQRCDDFTTVLSKERNKKIDEILNENSL